MSKPKSNLPMPMVIAIIGVVLVVAAGVVFMMLNNTGNSSVYKATDDTPAKGDKRTLAR